MKIKFIFYSIFFAVFTLISISRHSNTVLAIDYGCPSDRQCSSDECSGCTGEACTQKNCCRDTTGSTCRAYCQAQCFGLWETSCGSKPIIEEKTFYCGACSNEVTCYKCGREQPEGPTAIPGPPTATAVPPTNTPVPPTPTHTPTPTPPQRQGICESSVINKTTVSGREGITISSRARVQAKTFFYALYNMNNLYGPGNPKPLCVKSGGDFNTPADACPAGSHPLVYKDPDTTTLRFEGKRLIFLDEIFVADENTGGKIPGEVEFKGYFVDQNGMVSLVDPNCIERLVRVLPSPTPTQAPPTSIPGQPTQPPGGGPTQPPGGGPTQPPGGGPTTPPGGGPTTPPGGGPTPTLPAACGNPCNPNPADNTCPQECPYCYAPNGGNNPICLVVSPIPTPPAACDCDGITFAGDFIAGNTVTITTFAKSLNPATTKVLHMVYHVEKDGVEITKSDEIPAEEIAGQPGRYKTSWDFTVPTEAGNYHIWVKITCKRIVSFRTQPSGRVVLGTETQRQTGLIESIIDFLSRIFFLRAPGQVTPLAVPTPTGFRGAIPTVLAPTGADSLQLGTFKPVSNLRLGCKEIWFTIF